MSDCVKLAREADSALQSASRSLHSQSGMLYHQDICDALRHAEAACSKLTFLETIARGVPEPRAGE